MEYTVERDASDENKAHERETDEKRTILKLNSRIDGVNPSEDAPVSYIGVRNKRNSLPAKLKETPVSPKVDSEKKGERPVLRTQ